MDDYHDYILEAEKVLYHCTALVQIARTKLKLSKTERLEVTRSIYIPSEARTHYTHCNQGTETRLLTASEDLESSASNIKVVRHNFGTKYLF